MTIFVFIGSLLGLMALGMPIAFALIGCGLAMMFHMGVTDPQIVIQNMWDGSNSFPLLAVPFFMLAGEFMNAGGMTRRIINMAMAWIGHIPGGLGYVAVTAAVIMASLSGSAVADTAALASVLVPMMRTAGYDVNRSCGLIACGGIIAPVIPPSIGMIVFGVVANVSIGKLFMAAIVPGLMMGISLLVAWLIVARRDQVKVFPRMPMGQRLRVALDSVWALVMPAGIVGGMKFGVFTPTEAAVAAAVYAFVVGAFVYRELKLSAIYPILVSSAKTTAVVVFLIATALVSGWLITASDIPSQMSALLQPFIGSPIILMAMMMVLVVIVGTALDFAPTLLILTPVLMPIVREAGINPVYFGVLFIMNNAIGLITPPVGIVLNVVCGAAKLRMSELMKGLWPFLWAELFVLFLLVAFPPIVLVPLKWLSH